MSRPRNDGGDGDFLGRWSARKLKARAEPSAPLPDAPPGPEAAPAGPPGEAGPEQAPESDAEILQELGLPDPDSLVKGDDFKAFMRAGVPARLRNRALRKLWLSDPVLANLDGLNDYDRDFTDAATVVPALKTAYKIGRGFLRDEPQASAAAEAAPDASATQDATPDATQSSAEASPGEIAEKAPEAPESAAASGDPSPAQAGETTDDAGPPPRRMRFRFEAG